MSKIFKKIDQFITGGILVMIALGTTVPGANADTNPIAFINASNTGTSAGVETPNSVIIGGSFILATNSPIKNTKTVSTKNIFLPVVKELLVSVTGYSSTVDQCDASPFITASGTLVHDGIIAANFLPLGTKIKIPGYSGNKIFTVEDRMNKRYWQKIDIWFPDRESALEFGRQTLKIQILGS